jgi:hypothetical protein
MLSRDFTIRHGLTGLDPDKGPPDRSEADWLKAHPERKQRSAEERAAAGLRLAKGRASNNVFERQKAAQTRLPETIDGKPALVAGRTAK